MTFEEIREMVNETITANGQGNITGAALNTALNEILTAMSEFKPSGGGGSYTLVLEEVQTEENKAACKAIYDEIYPMMMGGTIPVLYVDLGNLMGGGSKALCIAKEIFSGAVVTNLGGSITDMVIIFQMDTQNTMLKLTNDGTTVPSQL